METFGILPCYWRFSFLFLELRRGVYSFPNNIPILTGKVARKDNQMIAQGGISIIYELNGLVPVLRGRCFIFEVGV